jgi:predicted unusual protein kinase regulating ubiquinone biosynthesis (AarF/ABC1/UbiB family)
VPAIPFDEVKKITSNFSDRALIGEGSYGRVYNATLSDGCAAVIKKLDPSASQDSDSDFAAQVTLSSCNNLMKRACPSRRVSLPDDRALFIRRP